MDHQPLPQAAHTRVPNILSDWVKPLLSSSERDCLDYIIRRTYGFSDGDGGRKTWDTIAIKQFVNGAMTGPYLRDLGTGLSEGTVKKALEGLEEKGIVESRGSCLRCLWKEEHVATPAVAAADADAAGAAPRGKGNQCPRCRTSLSRDWAVATIRPSLVIRLLNAHDKGGRQWAWDGERRRPRLLNDPSAQKTAAQKDADDRAEAVRLYKLLWCKDLAEECVALVQAQLKAGRTVSFSRRVTLYKHIIGVQEEYNNPPLVRYALEQTIKGPALRQPANSGWHRYLHAVAKANAHRFGTDTHLQGTNEQADQANSPRAREDAVRDLLSDAYKANVRGDHDTARALLSDILAQTKALAELFDGDQAKCERALRLSFKQGDTDFLGVRPNPHAPVDYYPEWTP